MSLDVLERFFQVAIRALSECFFSLTVPKAFPLFGMSMQLVPLRLVECVAIEHALQLEDDRPKQKQRL